MAGFGSHRSGVYLHDVLTAFKPASTQMTAHAQRFVGGFQIGNVGLHVRMAGKKKANRALRWGKTDQTFRGKHFAGTLSARGHQESVQDNLEKGRPNSPRAAERGQVMTTLQWFEFRIGQKVTVDNRPAKVIDRRDGKIIVKTYDGYLLTINCNLQSDRIKA